jgi:hypothetical protein
VQSARSMLARVQLMAAHVIRPGREPGTCRLRMSPDRWMSPRATRHRVVRWPDGMRNSTVPQEGASGTSHSVTPTAVTAFLLSRRPCLSPAMTSLHSPGHCQRSFEHSTPESSGRESDWVGLSARLVGGGATPRCPALWGTSRQAIPASLPLEPPVVDSSPTPRPRRFKIRVKLH